MFQNNFSNIYRDLATLLEVGIPAEQAAKKVAESHPKNSQWQNVIIDMQRGRKVAMSLHKNKLISNYEKEFIEVAENSGRLPLGLRRIADALDKRRTRVSKLKSKLVAPFLTLMVAIAVSAILTQILSPQMNVSEVIVRAFFQLGLAILVTKAILNLLLKDASFWLEKLSTFQNKRFYRMLFQQLVFSLVHWQIKSGIDFENSFRKVANLLKQPEINQSLIQVASYCGSGKSVTNACIDANLPLTPDFIQVLLTSEQSGQWDFNLDKYLSHQSEMLEIEIQNAYDWAPRIYYIIVAMIAISVIMG